MHAAGGMRQQAHGADLQHSPPCGTFFLSFMRPKRSVLQNPMNETLSFIPGLRKKNKNGPDDHWALADLGPSKIESLDCAIAKKW